MYAVNAFYDGAGNVKIDPAVISINAPYKVIVIFVEPAQKDEAKTTQRGNLLPNSHMIFSLCALKASLFSDFEDCLQMESAQTVNVDYIITRAISDFSGSPIPAISAEGFLKLFDDAGE
jgi:hypothetical protein